MTPLHATCEKGHLPTVQALVAAGARVDALARFEAVRLHDSSKVELQASPLACAALHDYADVVAFLLDSGADPNLGDHADPVRSSAFGVAAAGVSAWWRARLRTALPPGWRKCDVRPETQPVPPPPPPVTSWLSRRVFPAAPRSGGGARP